MTRHLVVVGQTAVASPSFLLDDLPGTSGRLDVLARALRAALLVSHGVRRDVVLDLVLCGGSDAPRTIRVDGAAVKFLRPDERAAAVLLQKLLRMPAGARLGEVRPGISMARAGLPTALAGASDVVTLDPRGADLRHLSIADDTIFVLGDHLGLGGDTRAELARRGARSTSVGPVCVHTEDAITLLHGELDRRDANRPR